MQIQKQVPKINFNIFKNQYRAVKNGVSVDASKQNGMDVSCR